jgi:hypothetical protein
VTGVQTCALPISIAEGLERLRRAVTDLLGTPAPTGAKAGPEVRIGTMDMPPSTLQVVDLKGEGAGPLLPQVHALETEQYGAKEGREPFLQYLPETLEGTLSHARALGIALRDRVTGRLVAYAIGSPLENHNELGVREDPAFGDNDTIYLQAMAVSPQLKNPREVETMILDAFRARAEWAGFAAFSTLIEQGVVDAGPDWLRGAPVLESADDYLNSGIRFVYLRVRLAPEG